MFSNLKTKKRSWHEKKGIGSTQARNGINISVLYFLKPHSEALHIVCTVNLTKVPGIPSTVVPRSYATHS